MTTNVPAPTFGANGFIAPLESAILAGAQADLNQAFGGNLNPALNTPQGQLASSLTAIIAQTDSEFLALSNGVDPAYAAGRMQDAIGRIYFLTRIPASSTTVTVRCTGAVGTVIPVGSMVSDAAGNLYTSLAAGTIPIAGFIDIVFSSVLTGPIACPIGYITAIYQAIIGWDRVENLAAGTPGTDVESRADFEFRRELSVAMNAQGTLDAILGTVLQVANVLDAYGTENVTSIQSGAQVIGTIATTVLTVSAVASGTLAVGDMVIGAGIEQGTFISSLGTGTGGTGTYNLNLTHTIGAPTTFVVAQGGVRLKAHSIYFAVYGGLAQSIGNAIWLKKSPGCDYNGNTTVTVTDSGNGTYQLPYPSYTVLFQIPAPVAIKFAITMATNAQVPNDAIAQVRDAVLATFNGSSGTSRARIGAEIYHSSYYSAIFALGQWVQIFEILVGVGTANRTSVLIGIHQVPTLTSTDISVTFS